jgi:hypothetical protein
MMHFAGLDLGQSQDYAALIAGDAELKPLRLDVRIIHRYPIKTSYAVILPDVAERLTAIGSSVALACDARGPGKPVIDMLAVWPGLRLRRLLAVANTSGREARRERRRNGDPGFLERWNVPKATLLQTLSRLIKSGGFRVADIPEARLLKSEFEHFAFQFSPAGNLKLQAAGGHDDLLLALVILIWAAVTEENYRGAGASPLPNLYCADGARGS